MADERAWHSRTVAGAREARHLRGSDLNDQVRDRSGRRHPPGTRPGRDPRRTSGPGSGPAALPGAVASVPGRAPRRDDQEGSRAAARVRAQAADPAARGPRPSERRIEVWVPRTSSTSCNQAVFVDHAADARVSSDTALLKIDWFG